MKNKVILEPIAQTFATDSSKPPLIYELPPKEGREKLEDLQNSKVYKYPAFIKDIKVNTGKYGIIKTYFVQPITKNKIRNVIFYIHGAGWVFGSFHTHEKLIRELSARTNSIIVFPEYSRSPEAKYPAAIEQCYAILNDLSSILKYANINGDLSKLTLAGDSVGGNMSIALSLLAKYRKGPKIHKQLLYYPVTNDNFSTDSYNRFGEDYYLTKDEMKWFWDQYAPDLKTRNYITTCPLKASVEQLSGLPDTMIINGEADVLRDEGEAFATKLMRAKVDVTQIRIKGIIHDFVMLNALDQANGCRTAMDASTGWINRKNKSED